MVFGSDWWSKASSVWHLKGERLQPEQDISDEYVLQQAYEELQQARNWFAHLEEPEMIDCAIYKIKAAEKHYDYLLKRIKRKQSSKK